MESSKNTAILDLYMLNRIALSCGRNEEFTSAYSFILLRDYCVVFEEIINAFKPPITLNGDIKKIRQNIKLFGKRGSLRNDGIYLKIRGIHEESFAKYENNIGLYLKDNKVIGSTMYSTFIFLGSNFENPYLTLYDNVFKEKLKSFLIETIPQVRMKLEPYILGTENDSFYHAITRVKSEESSIKCFDVRAEKFFRDDKSSIAYQTLQFRLLICLQELNYMIYIYHLMIERKETHFIDEYTFTRVLTRGLDSIVKNINNLWEYSNKEFLGWIATMDDDLKSKIKSIANNKELLSWTKKYRDMIHYSVRNEEKESNFLDVIKNDPNFINKCYEIYEDVVLPIHTAVSNFFIVDKSHQYSLLEMISMKFRGRFHDK